MAPSKVVIFLLVLLSLGLSAGIGITVALSVPSWQIGVVAITLGTIGWALVRFPKSTLMTVLFLAPFYDILRALFLEESLFIGIWQEVFILIMAIGLVTNYDGAQFKVPHWILVDYLVLVYMLWSLVGVILSPSLLGGLYVWRWYMIGPFIYFVLRFYALTSREITSILVALAGGLAVSSFFLLYEAFILGPEAASQWKASMGLPVLYRFGWRLSGSFSSPLVASASVSILLLLGVALFTVKRNIWLGLLLLGLGGVASALTLSRSGWLSGLVGWIAISILGRNWRSLILLVIAVVVGVTFLARLEVIDLPQLLMFTFGGGGFESEVGVRFGDVERILADAVTKYPFGTGFMYGGGAVSVASIRYFGGRYTGLISETFLAGDSVLLATLQAEGWVGFLVLVGIYAGFIRRALHLVRRSVCLSQQLLALVAFGFFVGTAFGLANLMDVWPLKFYLWLFGSLVVTATASTQ